MKDQIVQRRFHNSQQNIILMQLKKYERKGTKRMGFTQNFRKWTDQTFNLLNVSENFKDSVFTKSFKNRFAEDSSSSVLQQISKNKQDLVSQPKLSAHKNPDPFSSIENRLPLRKDSKEKQNLYNKITEYIKNQEEGVTLSGQNLSKQIQLIKKRPYTSLSRQSRKPFDLSNFGRSNYVLIIPQPQATFQQKQPQKISTSRALMNYSRLYKRSSTERFKVKKQKCKVSRFAQVSAQKVVFQQKQKSSRKDIYERLKLGTSLSSKRNSVYKENEGSKRYQEEEFQIGGWDYMD